MGSLSEKLEAPCDIAVVGLSCRFPGGASSPTKFWDLLYNRKSAYTEVPKSRYNGDAFYHPSDKLGTLRCHGGHFLENDVSSFDAPFFNITAQEAKAMDPTARMLLEVTYEAIENAGLDMHSLVGSDTSCYVGCFTRDWHEQQIKDSETAPMYAGTGTGFSLLSNRISWFYDFRGPSLTLDTACSSSLVGLHLACQGLRMGESKLAIVSGANLILSPDLAVFLSNLHMLSKEGLSRSFADDTSGYGRGEGIATLILKPVADALRDGDSIRAVIRGTGVNQDGHTTGITVPNSDAQAELIRSTYRSAGLDLSQTAYFEAHGTGTAVGDPLELGAVARTMGDVRKKGDRPLIVGSVKSNIGHLEGAAGLAGVIKCILMLESGTILPNIHFDRPNRRIPFDDWNISVPTSAFPWPVQLLRRASVNSFGYGGTNAHAIIDGAADYLSSQGWKETQSLLRNGDNAYQRMRLFVVSANDDAALNRLRSQYCDHLASAIASNNPNAFEEESSYLDRLCYTLCERRTRFDWKAYVIASTIKELHEQLSLPTIPATRSGSTKPRTLFVFTGQGAQWARMGVELMQFPVFSGSVLGAERYLKDKLGCDWSVLEELERDPTESNIQLAKFSQPICTVLQVALIDLLASWNVRPEGVVGHSSGEIGAAYAYGAITREDAWSIAFWRGKLCSALVTEAPDLKGSMAAVGLSKEDAQQYVSATTRGKVVVACVNSPSSVTLSGDEAAIDELADTFKTKFIFCRKLKVENAYHSHHMQRVAERYSQKISSIRPTSTTSNVVMASSVTGQLVGPSELGPEYWVRNLVSPVLFLDAVKTLFTETTQRRRRARTVQTPFNFTLEVGPHAALKGPLRQILQAADVKHVQYKSVILRGEDARKTAIDAAGTLYVQGAPVALSTVNGIHSRPQPLTDLPTYPWNHSLKYWSESRLSKNYRFRKDPYHDLLGTIMPGSNELEPTWRNVLRTTEKPWLRDHVVHSAILYPAAGILAMPIEAMRQLADKEQEIKSIQLKEVAIGKAIVVPDDQIGVEVILQLRRQKSSAGSPTGWWQFTVFSGVENQQLEENGSGLVTLTYKSDNTDAWAVGKSRADSILSQEYKSSVAKCERQIIPQEFYDTTRQAGLDYGTSFQGLTEISAGRYRCCCTVSIPDTKSTMPEKVESEHLIHPTTLDIIFHSLFAALGEDGQLHFETAAVPVSFGSLVISSSLPPGARSEFRGFCTATREEPREILADICYSDGVWEEPKVQIKGLRCRELPRSSTKPSADSLKAPLGTLEWKPDLEFWEGPFPAETSLEQTICKVLALAAHKNPEISILQIGGDAPLVTTIVSSLAANPVDTARFSKFVFADTNTTTIENVQAASEEWRSKVSIITLDGSLDLKQQNLQPRSFDVVIAAPNNFEATQTARFLKDAEDILEPGGLVLILEPVKQGSTSNTWEKSLAETKLALLSESIHSSSQSALYLARKPSQEDAIDLAETVYIIHPPEQTRWSSDVGHHVREKLSKQRLQSQSVTWPPDPSKLIGKPLISLLELDTPLLANVSSPDFDLLKQVVLRCSSLTWVCGGIHPTMDAATGYLRVLKNENPNLNLRYLGLREGQPGLSADKAAHIISRVATEPSIDREFAQIGGQICISRWMPNHKLTRITEQSLSMTETVSLGGSSSSLKLVPGSSKSETHFAVDNSRNRSLLPDEVEIEVKALGLSRSSDDSAKEFSGIVKSIGGQVSRLRIGDRVYGCQMGPYRTRYTLKEQLCQKIPDRQPFETAATWAITLATAYQSLVRTAKVGDGQRILVQGAACGVGLAAIEIGQACKATVHATVRTEKEAQLIQRYGVAQGVIFNDKDPELHTTFSTFTNQKGFDLILATSSDGEVLRQLWNCVSPSGFLINVAVGALGGALDLAPFQKGCTFSQVNMGHSLREKPSEVAAVLEDLSNYLGSHKLKPTLFSEVLSAAQIAEALKLVQAPDGPGEAVVTFDAQDYIPINPSARKPLSLRKNATYILTGGLGGLGRSLARLLVAHGAGHLLFISRSGLKSANAQALVDEITALGASVHVHACDISDEVAMKNLIAECSGRLPAVRGVIQSAAVLNDAIYDNVTHSLWQEAVSPKIQGSWLLHKLLPENMDFFVMLSSIAGVVGNRSQASYATGNTFQDGLARYRRAHGQPAVAVDLGLMLGIGLIAERGGFTNLHKSEAVGLNEIEFHEIMKAAIVGSYGEAVIPPQLVTGLPNGGILHRQGLEPPFYYDDPRFLFLKKMGLEQAIQETGGGQDNSETGISLATQLGQCKSLGEAAGLVTTALCALLAKALQTSPENIDASRPLHTYGVDSLMAVEIRTWILQQIKADVTLFDVLSGASISAMAIKVVASSKLVPPGTI